MEEIEGNGEIEEIEEIGEMEEIEGNGGIEEMEEIEKVQLNE